MKIKFGPAGSPVNFKEEGFKTTLDLPKWLGEKNLTAFEYPCGRGFTLGEDFAEKLGKAAAKEGISMSLHAPYYINLATDDEEKKMKNINYLQDAVKFSLLMGADRIVLHPGGASKGRVEALERAESLFEEFLNWLDEKDPTGQLKIGVETHGTKNQLGNLEEIIALCKIRIGRVLPVVDWAHLYAVANGGYSEVGDFLKVLEKMGEELGGWALKNLHMHFSAIEFGPSGEVRHRTFAEKIYGPSPEPLIRALKSVEGEGRIICECAGTQDVDALYLKNIYENMVK